jgi:hypothetical protein
MSKTHSVPRLPVAGTSPFVHPGISGRITPLANGAHYNRNKAVPAEKQL